jgi:hypothetical protein
MESFPSISLLDFRDHNLTLNLPCSYSIEYSIFPLTGIARVHQTLRVTPAMEAGISGHIWSFQEIVALADLTTVKKAA